MVGALLSLPSCALPHDFSDIVSGARGKSRRVFPSLSFAFEGYHLASTWHWGFSTLENCAAAVGGASLRLDV